MLIKNMQGQPARAIINPPSDGPVTKPRATNAPFIPNALPLSAPGKARTIMALGY
nr:hypothetical protein [Pectinatus frisingensis]